MGLLFVLIGVALLVAAVTFAEAYFFTKMVIHPVLRVPEEVRKETYALDFMGKEFCDMVDNAKQFTVTTEDGLTLRGRFLAKKAGKEFADGKERVVIICHGWTNCFYNMLRYARFFYDMGFNCVMYDHRNHGYSDKKITFMGLQEAKDLQLVIDKAKEEYGSNIVLGTMGESMGAATVMINSGFSKDLDFVIDDCGFSHLKGQLSYNLCHTYGKASKRENESNLHYNFTKAVKYLLFILPKDICLFWADLILKRQGGYSLKDVRPIDSVKKSGKVPMLFIHGGDDNFIDHNMMKELYEAKEGKKACWECPGADHAVSIDTDREKYIQVVTEFFKDNNIL
ncbi:MAG: alpha/beta hydrolase [Lachnospiraceae bacterium]|nr:alpha/beta hydrolase [Lachnospiraceae bacterium]